jgi:hypothetical protein
MPASRWIGFALAGGALACSQNPAPTGWLAPARAAQSDPYGAWIVVWPPAGPEVAGEFLAVDRDTVFVLPPGGGVRAVALGSVEGALVAFYDAQWGGLTGWTMAGALSTISNGWFSAFTFPLWTIGGSLITGGQSRAPLRRVRSAADWSAVRMFARFPAGLPPDLPRTLPPKERRRAPP